MNGSKAVVENERILYWDIAKGITILLVVLGHLNSVNPYVKGIIFTYHMPFFFIANAYFENGHISCSVPDAAADQLLYLSVPYDEGWSITNNGKKIRPGGFAGTMISIPLHEGKNVIVMEYTIPGLKKGILMSVAGIILLALSYLLREKAEKRIKKEK